MRRPSFIAYVTPWATGENDQPKPPMTTLSLGEESGSPKPKPVTSMMVGEETGSPR